MRRCGVCSTSRSTSVVLPAPEGADTMNSRPRPLLGILDLLAHLLELRFGGDDELGNAQAVSFRAHRVDLAVHLLEQEIELPTARFGAVGQRDPMGDVPAEALHLFT